MILVNKETDVVSLAALILSLLALLPQVFFFVRGASPSLVEPEVIVFHEELGVSGIPHLALTAPMVYLNLGSPNSNFVVLKQSAELHVGSDSFQLRASHVVETNSLGNEYLNTATQSALPFSVTQEQGYAEKVKYLPRPPECDNSVTCNHSANIKSIEEFLGGAAVSEVVRIDFWAETSLQAISTSCEFQLSPGLRIALIEHRWVAVDCLPSKRTKATR